MKYMNKHEKFDEIMAFIFERYYLLKAKNWFLEPTEYKDFSNT